MGTEEGDDKMKPTNGGRPALAPHTKTALLVLISCLSTSFVATRMLQVSRLHWALLKDLDEADRTTRGIGENGYIAPLTGPRLVDDPLNTVSMRAEAGTRDKKGADNPPPPQLRGQIDGVARGKVYGWACEVGPANDAAVAAYVDGFLVAVSRPRQHRQDRTVAKICGRHPYTSAECGFSLALPPLSAGRHEIRAFIRDGAGKVKAELGGSPWRHEEAPTALAIADELARKDEVIRDQNRIIAELEAQLGSTRAWAMTQGLGGEDNIEGEKSVRDKSEAGEASGKGKDGLPPKGSAAARIAEELAAGAAEAKVRADGHVVHAVTLSSEAGKKGGKERLLAFVGVNTGYASRDRRDILRSTWFPTGPALRKMEVEHGLLFRFVIGNPLLAGDAMDLSLQDEISQYDDFFRLRHTETYDKLSDKTVMWFSAAVTTVDADFYLKVDDDIHLRIPALGRFLVSHRLSRAIYFGCMKTGPVLANPKLRWHEPEWWRFGEVGNKYFRHCSGQIYGVSRLVAQYIHDHSSMLHRYANEDVSVGSWVMGLDVEFVDERNMCCQDCRGSGKCIATFNWGCSGVCEPIKNIPLIHKSCPQY